MQFYCYLLIKNLKLLNMKKYDEFWYGLFHQDWKLLKSCCINILNLIDYFSFLFWVSSLFFYFVNLLAINSACELVCLEFAFYFYI